MLRYFGPKASSRRSSLILLLLFCAIWAFAEQIREAFVFLFELL